MKEDDIGVWIDEREALIVSYNSGLIKLKRLYSEVESYHVTGGAGSSTPYGPQDAVSETGYLRRKKQQLKRYFKLVIQELESARRIYVLGPAEAKEGLVKDLVASKEVVYERLNVETADSMTDNQLKARVSKFFS